MKVYSRIWLGSSLLGVALGLGACSNTNPSSPDLGTRPDMAVNPPPVTGPVAKGPSKSGTIAISDDDATVAVVNQDRGSVSFFNTANNALLSTVTTGGTPSSVVIASVCELAGNRPAFGGRS